MVWANELAVNITIATINMNLGVIQRKWAKIPFTYQGISALGCLN